MKMRKIYAILAFIFLTKVGLAQEKSKKIIKRDTIHLRGYIYDYMGKPMKYVYIRSSQKETLYNVFKVYAVTDTAGYFDLKGAKLNDTLKIAASNLYNSLEYYNKDSRYMVIYLPMEKTLALEATGTIQITRIRKTRKITPSFALEVLSGGEPFTEIHILPHYKNGNAAYIDYIRRNINYPENAFENNIEGTVQIGFVVERDGSLLNFKVLRGIGYGCDEEVINILKKSPHWQPGIDNGRPVTMRATVSVEFKLTNK